MNGADMKWVDPEGFARRIWMLRRRGLSYRMAEMLWFIGEDFLVADLERAPDGDIAALCRRDAA